MTNEVKLLKHQYEALQSCSNEVLLLGGIGSGKSQLGAIWIVDKIAKFPNCECIVAANTYQQLMNASVKTITNYLDDLDIHYNSVLSGARKRIEIGDATIYLYSLDKPDSIRGIEVSFSWLDEVAFSSLKALNVVRGRMRGQKSSYRQTLMTTSGNGFNFLYDIFGNLGSNNQKKQMISAQTKDNKFLPEGYYEELVKNYGGIDTPLAQQELFGKFVNLQEGAIYNLFNRERNVAQCIPDKKLPVYVGMDFNVDIMSATYSQFIDGKLYVFKEVQLTHRNANTYDMANHIKEDLLDQGYNVFIVPDSTGKARKTSSSSGQTDHQILREAGFEVLVTSNPMIRDRQQSVNIGFRRENIVIDPSCGKLIKDIETLSSRNKEGSVSHLGPCLGYTVWYLMPVKRKTNKSRQIEL